MSLRKVGVVFMGVMFAGSVALAEAVLSCDEVNELGEALTELGIVIESGEAIGEGTEADGALRDVVDGLALIADAEQDPDLAEAAVGMDEAWHAMDRTGFNDYLALAVGKLAVIATSECDG